MIKLITIITLFFIYSCSNTSPTIVQNTDAQKVTAVEYGTIKTSLPVKIKGESDWIGATAGAMIGGLLATQICGEEEVKNKTVTIRKLGSEKQETIDLQTAVKKISQLNQFPIN